jgi:NADPH:quinone reductase-like Zn-dependent oxidoreductase
MTNKAWVFRSNPTSYDLRLEERIAPSEIQIPVDSVLIRVHAVSLNYRDLIAWRNLAGRQVDGRVPTSDGAGEVVACGKDVQNYKVGDRVAACFFQTWQSGAFELGHHKHDLGGTLDGMLQDYICLPESGVVAIPQHMSFEQAATLPCAALTAWYSLIERGSLREGQKVLCLGTGGVSIFALQIAVAMGCEVFITSSDNSKLYRAKSMGASHTINYREQPQWADEVWRLSGKTGVDHVVEVGGPGTLEQSMKAVAASGHIALIGVLTGFGAPTASLFPLVARNVRLNGIYVGPRDQFDAMNRFLERKKLIPVIDRTFEMEDAESAFHFLESGKHFGKVVIRLVVA